jgi:hypothetical protein
MEDAAGSIRFFEEGARGERAAVIEGIVAENSADSTVRSRIESGDSPALAGVEIIASRNGREYKAATDRSGLYYLRVPGAGKYRVTSKLAGHGTGQSSYEVEVAQDSCQELDLGMLNASRVAGHLRGADGKPAQGITVSMELVSMNEHWRDEGKTNAAGEFEFAHMPRGAYVISVNREGLSSESPYAARFYPGVEELASAGIVRITGPDVIEGLDFQIGERRPMRKIIVDVAWADGRPVTNANVLCAEATPIEPGTRRDWVNRNVDLIGEATCEVLAEFDYVVEAFRLTWEASNRPVQPVATRPKISVRAGTDTVHVKLVVDLANDISATEAPVNLSEFNDRDF